MNPISNLLENKQLRPVHDPRIDWQLAKLFKFEGETPWVISQQLAHRMIALFKADNEKLMTRLDIASQDIMKEDERWRDSQAFKDNYIQDLTQFKLSNDEKSELLLAAINLLLNG